MRQGGAPAGPEQRVGVVASFDFAQQRELLRWVPADVVCDLTFTGDVPYRDNLELVTRLSEPGLLRQPVRRLVADGAAAVAFLCTACSFAGGAAGEAALRDTMTAAGAASALTTSSAVTDALTAVGARRVAVVHPYQEPVARLLTNYLENAGFSVVGVTSLGLDGVADIYRVQDRQVLDAGAAGDRATADALFVSCTALPTYDAVPLLEARTGKPVVTANQATMWALLGAVGLRACGPGQQLLQHSG